MVLFSNQMSFLKKISILICFIFLTILFSLPLIRSGITYDYGIGYWGPTGHDLIWHQSLINHITSPLSIPIPSFSGQPLINYHPFYNILISAIHRLTHISISLLIFQIFPILSSAIFIYLSYVIGKLITKKNSGGYLLALVNTTASSAGFIVTLVNNFRLGGESVFWSMQSASLQINPPLILSLIFLQIILIFIIRKSSFPIVILLLVLLPITKAYGGITGYIIWALYSLYSLTYKNTKPLIFLILSLPLAYLTFRIYNPSASSLLEFKPLWFIDQMFSSPDKVFLPRVSSALQNYKLAHSFKAIPIYLIGISIFLFGNYFWRLLGLLTVLKNKNYFNLIIITTASLLLIIPLLFIQKGTAWNTIQFIYYSLFLFNILLVLFFLSIKKTTYYYLTVSLFIVTSLLTNIDTYRGFLGNPPPASIPKSELSALEFLNTLSPGVVLTYPFDSHHQDIYSHTPIPLYAYITSSYIPALTHHQTFISDEMNLNNSGYPWQARLDASKIFFKQENQFQDRGFLVNNQIDYIYLTGQQKTNLNLDQNTLSLVKIYDDQNSIIYKVNR